MKFLRHPLFLIVLVFGGVAVAFQLYHTWSELNHLQAGLAGRELSVVPVPAVNVTQEAHHDTLLSRSGSVEASASRTTSPASQEVVSAGVADMVHPHSAFQAPHDSSGSSAPAQIQLVTRSSSSSQTSGYRPAQSGMASSGDGYAANPTPTGGFASTQTAVTGSPSVATTPSTAVSSESASPSDSSSGAAASSAAPVNSQSSQSFQSPGAVSPSSSREVSPNAAYIEAYNAYKAQYGAQAAMQQQLGQPVQ